MLTLNSTEIMI